MSKKYFHQVAQECLFFGLRLLPLYLIFYHEMKRIILFVIISDALYYFFHRFFHNKSWQFCVPFHHYHHANPESFWGIVTSDTFTMLIWLTPLIFFIDVPYCVLVYLIVFQSIVHYVSHFLHHRSISVRYFDFKHHAKHHDDPGVNFSPIYWDMLLGTVSFDK